MRNLLLTLCYDGAQYHGWQIQNNAVSVQQVFQEALFKVTSEKPETQGVQPHGFRGACQSILHQLENRAHHPLRTAAQRIEPLFAGGHRCAGL